MIHYKITDSSTPVRVYSLTMHILSQSQTQAQGGQMQEPNHAKGLRVLTLEKNSNWQASFKDLPTVSFWFFLLWKFLVSCSWIRANAQPSGPLRPYRSKRSPPRLCALWYLRSRHQWSRNCNQCMKPHENHNGTVWTDCQPSQFYTGELHGQHHVERHMARGSNKCSLNNAIKCSPATTLDVFPFDSESSMSSSCRSKLSTIIDDVKCRKGPHMLKRCERGMRTCTTIDGLALMALRVMFVSFIRLTVWSDWLGLRLEGVLLLNLSRAVFQQIWCNWIVLTKIIPETNKP